MYDELIGELHIVASGVQSKRRRELLEKAADAIEELSKCLDGSIPKGDAEIIISEVAKPRWIPVTERLPEKDGPVLAYYGFDHGSGMGKMFMQVMDYYATDPKPHFQHEGYANLIVIHWMPLPEPPKEETE